MHNENTPVYKILITALTALRNVNNMAPHIPEHKLEWREQLGWLRGVVLRVGDITTDEIELASSVHGVEYIKMEAHTKQYNDNGYRESDRLWSVSVFPDLQFDINVKVHGRDYRGTKEYLADELHHVLTNPLTAEEWSGYKMRFMEKRA